MKNWTITLVGPDATIHDAIKAIDTGEAQVALVVDGENKLLGTVTDGDIRRGILKGIALGEAVTRIMKTPPITMNRGVSNKAIHQKMLKESLHQIPLVDGDGRVVGLAHIDDMGPQPRLLENWVVLMAGGLGTRLQPLTDDIPKPMLGVGGKPLLEIILESFIKHDFHRFYISVNYKAEMIKDHFGDGSKLGIEIRYLEEEKRLGTAGALGLLPETPQSPLIVMNSDLLTGIDFKSLLSYHSEQHSQATMCVREYDFQVPFGVVDIEDNRIVGIDEKPVHRFFVNAGVYVVEPKALALVATNQNLDMPDFFRTVIDDGHATAVFPIREYWMDIGRIDDLEQAKREFPQEFEES